MVRYISLILLFSISFSQEIIGEGLSGQPLLDYVVNNYKTSTTLGYNTARDTLYGTIDLQEGNQLSCIYSGYTITLDTTQDPSTDAYNQGINCEHTYPQSMGAGEEPQKSDMHHLFPCKSNVNSSRGNDPYAEVPDEDTDTWYRNDYSQNTIPTEYIEEYAEKYNPPDPTDQTFEPREDHKGDVSRAVFYFFAMYNDVANTNFWNEQRDVLLDWHYYDEVDEWEINRTWSIASYQENQPNPFVLDSSLARRIWYMDDGGTDTSSTDTTVYNIIINEIMQNPSAVSDSDGEWFEIYNAEEDTVDISGWTFNDADNDSLSLAVDCCLNIPPNGYFLMICNWDTATNGGISNYDFIYNRSDFTLGNSDDEIIIIDSYGLEVDRVEYSTDLGFPDSSGASMELTYYEEDNNVGSNWVESANLLPSGDYGTPGMANSMLAPSIIILGVNTEQEYLLVNPQTYEPPELGDCLIMDYPYEYVGPCDSAYFDIVIQNSGTAQLIIDDYHFTDELFPIVDNRWNVVDTLPIIIPPASNDTIQVRFIPWRYTNFDYWFGIRENTLVLENNDPDNDSVSVDLSIPVVLNGTGYTLSIYGWTPEWTVNGPNQPIVDFGTVSVGDSLDTTIVLTSYGIDELEVDGVSPVDMPFSLVADDGEMNLFESIDIEITFTPEEFGDFADTIYVESNAQMFYPVFTIDTGSPEALPPEPRFIIKGIGWECAIGLWFSEPLAVVVATVGGNLMGFANEGESFDLDYNGTFDIIDLLIATDIVNGDSDYYDCRD